ncbi:MAG TPA: ABC transporter ATP-binding protein [Woeseiaceae bacterium]|nr:ABC transporter ATP-binding protein [Woeseiaceae bacterium]
MRIVLDQVSKHYQAGEHRQTVLDEVGAAFDSGRFVAVLGRSGSGKSTLLNLIAGFDEPSAGRIAIGEQQLSDAPDRERTLFRRRHLGFVFQFFNLLPTLTAGENVRLPLELLDVPAGEGRERADAALAGVGMAGFRDRFPEELSGGEQQRVAIARALIHEPAIVLADEPTGNLDLTTAQQVVELLDDACRRQGTTLIMATHSTEVVGYADEVYEVREGRLERQ